MLGNFEHIHVWLVITGTDHSDVIYRLKRTPAKETFQTRKFCQIWKQFFNRLVQLCHFHSPFIRPNSIQFPSKDFWKDIHSNHWCIEMSSTYSPISKLNFTMIRFSSMNVVSFLCPANATVYFGPFPTELYELLIYNNQTKIKSIELKNGYTK